MILRKKVSYLIQTLIFLLNKMMQISVIPSVHELFSLATKRHDEVQNRPIIVCVNNNLHDLVFTWTDPIGSTMMQH